MMRVLVCGGRDYQDWETVKRNLDSIHLNHKIDSILHGCAPGADSLADKWARGMGISLELFPANWKAYGGGAGPIRNKLMAETAPDLVIAFPGGAGTWNMIRTAERYGIPVLRA